MIFQVKESFKIKNAFKKISILYLGPASCLFCNFDAPKGAGGFVLVREGMAY